MKFAIYLTLLLSLNIYSQECYVTAKTWLNVRESPNIKSRKIGKIKFNEKVTIIENSLKEFELNNNGKVITGFWVKIKFNEIEGYVFDGFLTLVEKFDKEFIDFFKNDIYTQVIQYKITLLYFEPFNKNFWLKGNLMYTSYNTASRIKSLHKIKKNTFKIDYLLRKSDTLKIIDASKKIVMLGKLKYVPKKFIDSKKKVAKNPRGFNIYYIKNNIYRKAL